MKTEGYPIQSLSGINITTEKADEFKFSVELIKKVVKQIAKDENFEINDLSIVLTDDLQLQKLNNEWLDEDEPTDVLAFDLSETNQYHLDGEIYISLDRVHEQAKVRGDLLEVELLRLIAHGMLHLCGIDHDDDVSLREMTDRGEIYIKLFFYGK